MSDLQPVLLSGGAGTRLWPLSREAHPKQFLALAGGATLLQQAWLRVAPLARRAPLVVANEEHRFLVGEQLRQVGVEHPRILLEPVGRNTAPAIAAAALLAMADGADPLLLVLPSDHVVRDPGAFRDAVVAATGAAAEGALVTFGVRPRGPETGYGYIEAAEGEGLRGVLRFTEKPDADTAARYVASGRHYWNSGIFLFRASRYLGELGAYRPDILAAVREAMREVSHDGDFVRMPGDAFAACPAESIDYAVMERTSAARVMPVEMGWSDLGSWASLWEQSGRDADGNALHGDVVVVDSRNCHVHARRLVALVGVEDLVVADTDDAVLVARRDRVQRVREVVERLRAEGRSHALRHRQVHRPWGSYDAVDAGERFQVKRIRVRPGGRLSLQSHRHRAEHWVVVSGVARVTRGDEVFELRADESTFIPAGTLHRLENPGTEVLELIEVQTGSYFGEDDIVRYEDAYGRAGGNGAVDTGGGRR